MQTIRETPQDAVQAFTAKAIMFYVKYAQTVCESTAAYYKAQAERYERFAASAQASVAAAPEVAPVVATVTVQPVKARCPHYKAIQAFAAAARDAGLDMKAKDRSRGAVGVFFGKRIESRADLTGRQWEQATAAIKAGKLFW